jgi:hypothetical protein
MGARIVSKKAEPIFGYLRLSVTLVFSKKRTADGYRLAQIGSSGNLIGTPVVFSGDVAEYR